MVRFSLALFCLVTSACFAQFPDEQNRFRLAQSFEQAGEYERAIQLYEDLGKKDSLNYLYFDALRRCYTLVKRYDDALKISFRRLRLQPNDIGLMTSIGGLYSISGKDYLADSVWNGILNSSPKNALFYRTVAAEQINQRLFDRAIATYSRARTEIGNPNLFTGELAYLHSVMMNYPDATREYLRLLMTDEHQLDFVESRIATFGSQPDGLPSALRVTQEHIADNPKNVALLRLMVWLNMERKNFDAAFAAAQSIESIVHSSGTELFVFAERTFREKEYSIAAKAYRASLQAGSAVPFQPMAKFGYARCMEELSSANDSNSLSFQPKVDAGKHFETDASMANTIALYAAVASEYPFTEIGAQSLYRIGMLRYQHLFDLDGAVRYLDSVRIIVPASPMIPLVLGSIGDINVAQGKLDEARKRYAQATAAQACSPQLRTQIQFKLAEIEYFLLHFDTTVVLLKQLTKDLKIDESNDALQLQFRIMENKNSFLDVLKEFAAAEFLARQRKVGEAIGALNALIAAYPSSPLYDDALLLKGFLCTSIHLYPEALSAYQKLIVDVPNSTERDKAQFRIGELYQYRFREKEKAIKSYEELLEKYPESFYSEEARKRIRSLRGDTI